MWHLTCYLTGTGIERPVLQRRRPAGRLVQLEILMIRLNRFLISAALLGTALPSSPLFASSDWELLGTRRVNLAQETDVIDVTRRDGRFNAIRIEVDNGPIEMYDIRVLFANGEDFSPTTRVNFHDGAATRIIDLPGDARSIDKIVFRYKGRVRRGTATVRVYGRQAGEPHGGGNPAADGWVHMGARQVDFRSDHDVIPVEGRTKFNSILVAVEGADVELYNISVNFANGEHFDPEARLVFEENSRSRVIDLPGTARDIKNIEFRYRTLRQGSDGKAIVHVYGKTRDGSR